MYSTFPTFFSLPYLIFQQIGRLCLRNVTNLPMLHHVGTDVKPPVSYLSYSKQVLLPLVSCTAARMINIKHKYYGPLTLNYSALSSFIWSWCIGLACVAAYPFKLLLTSLLTFSPPLHYLPWYFLNTLGLSSRSCLCGPSGSAPHFTCLAFLFIQI